MSDADRIKRSRRRTPAGETLGGMLAGFDQQIMRNLPPPHELVRKGAPVRGLSGEDPGDLAIVLPAADADPAQRPDRPEDSPSTADLFDADPDGYEACELVLADFGGVTRFSGRVRTVRCHEDNVLLRRMLGTPGEGQVVVVDGGGSRRTALLGALVATLAVEHGWAGIVIHGCVRDVDALARLPIGIRALGAHPRRSAKVGLGEVDVDVRFGEATFRPAAILVADADGIIVTRSVDRG